MPHAEEELWKAYFRDPTQTMPGWILIQGMRSHLSSGVRTRLWIRRKDLLQRLLPQHRELPIQRSSAAETLRNLQQTRRTLPQFLVLKSEGGT